jgi:hypothetical protein
VLSCSEGRQWQIGAREVVEDGGRECELRAGWIRRMFSGASRPGLVWSVPWDWLQGRARAHERWMMDGPCPCGAHRQWQSWNSAQACSPAATSIDLEDV